MNFFFKTMEIKIEKKMQGCEAAKQYIHIYRKKIDRNKLHLLNYFFRLPKSLIAEEADST